MIKVKNITPQIYYKQSRDFQFIGRLFDIIFNYSKTNSANLSNLPIGQNLNENLLNLLALTLGFKATRNYNSKQLLAICGVLPTIMKQKGSLNSVITAANALLVAEGISQPLDFSIESKNKVTIYISQKLTDINLLRNLLEYILPAGISCSIVRENQEIISCETPIYMTDDVTVYTQSEPYISQIAQPSEITLNGTIGANLGTLANTTIIKENTTEKITTQEETTNE